MKYLFKFAVACTLAAAFSAHAKDNAEHKQQVIDQHKAIAQAHQAAAQCLASGKAEELCHTELAKACKGLAIGKYCGMKHRH